MIPEVRPARHIRYLIKNRADLGDADDVEKIADSAMATSTQEHESDVH